MCIYLPTCVTVILPVRCPETDLPIDLKEGSIVLMLGNRGTPCANMQSEEGLFICLRITGSGVGVGGSGGGVLNTVVYSSCLYS